ncbi:hypothetical protein [Streptomyces sp. NBC_01353]|uniref:hypothetical protein n=1 Tax=Streptomyces sp. NBC_01353 TaxID=2903835 RepID=UPI002E378397|nr:hypothetical protein [Streptomyces sp. NBC_01353]
MSKDRTKSPPLHPRPDAFADAMRRMKRDNERVVRPARRTLAEMAPGYQRQPLLRIVPLKAADDTCPICSYWKCRCGDSFAPVPAAATAVKAVAA